MSDNELPRPVSYDDLYPGRFLKAADLKGGKVTLRIREVRTEMLADERGGEKIKAVVAFERTDKAMVLCKTNGLCLKAMFGSKLSAWVGKRVTIYPVPNVFKGNDAIRIWGSHDIERDLDIDIVLPRKKPKRATMHKMAAAVRQPEPPPADDDDQVPA